MKILKYLIFSLENFVRGTVWNYTSQNASPSDSDIIAVLTGAVQPTSCCGTRDFVRLDNWIMRCTFNTHVRDDSIITQKTRVARLQHRSSKSIRRLVRRNASLRTEVVHSRLVTLTSALETCTTRATLPCQIHFQRREVNWHSEPRLHVYPTK